MAALIVASMARRLLLLNTDLEIGGTPTVVRELAVRLRSPYVHVEVACLAGWGPVADQLRQVGVQVTALGARRVTAAGIVLPRLVALIRRGGFDTVLSFLIHANTLAAAASLVCRSVGFFQSIQSTLPDPRWHWRLQGVVHRAAERVIVPSPSIAAAARRWSGLPAGKLVVIPNAVDPADFAPSPIPQAEPRPYPIGFIGRLHPVKRVPDLIRAVAELDQLVHLHVFGYGPEQRRIEDEIERLRPRPQVTLHGRIARPQQALGQIGLLVLPSAAEGFGLVLIEAMAAGVPIVATDVPGIHDVVHNGRTGLLVPPASPRALAEAIRRVVSDRELRASLARRAMASLHQRFTWPGVLEQYRAVLFKGQPQLEAAPR